MNNGQAQRGQSTGGRAVRSPRCRRSRTTTRPARGRVPCFASSIPTSTQMTSLADWVSRRRAAFAAVILVAKAARILGAYRVAGSEAPRRPSRRTFNATSCRCWICLSRSLPNMRPCVRVRRRCGRLLLLGSSWRTGWLSLARPGHDGQTRRARPTDHLRHLHRGRRRRPLASFMNGGLSEWAAAAFRRRRHLARRHARGGAHVRSHRLRRRRRVCCPVEPDDRVPK